MWIEDPAVGSPLLTSLPEATAAALKIIEALRQSTDRLLSAQHGGLGHNHPPPDSPDEKPDNAEIQAALDDTKDGLVSENPDRIAGGYEKLELLFVSKVWPWLRGLGVAFVTAAVAKSGGDTGDLLTHAAIAFAQQASLRDIIGVVMTLLATR